MKCHLCGGWKTPILLGVLSWHCSPCGVKQYEEPEAAVKAESYTTPDEDEGGLF